MLPIQNLKHSRVCLKADGHLHKYLTPWHPEDTPRMALHHKVLYCLENIQDEKNNIDLTKYSPMQINLNYIPRHR